MNQLEIEFDAFFETKGGICRDIFDDIPLIQSFLLYARAEIEFLRKREGNIPPIYVDLDNLALNAASGRNGDKYYIGLYKGALLQSFTVFSRMLACNTILTDIGNPSMEDAPQKLHDIQLKEELPPLLSFTRNLIPKDPVRSETVKMFVKHILDFLIFHEYAHIVYGHVDYHDSILKQPATPADPLILQTLEASADGFSAFVNMQILFKVEPDENPIILQELKSYYKHRDAVLKMWLFPIYTYFRLFGFANMRHCITTDSHPAPGCRVTLVLEMIQAFMDYTFSDNDAKALAKQCINIIMEVEDAFAQISEQGPDTRALKLSFSQEMINHAKYLSEKEYEILDFLKEYSYVPRYT